MIGNRFGHFGSDGRSFEITDHATPMPWTNVISNGRYGLIVSQNGGGFSWFDDAQHCVLTRWEMDLVRDCYGKFLYLSDVQTGEVWSASPAPTFVPMQQYRCTHAVGHTKFATRVHGIETQWTLSVSPSDQCEVWLVTITNTDSTPRTLRVSSYFEWTCGVAPDAKREFHKLFFTTSFDAKRKAIVAVKNMWDIPPKGEKQHWNQNWPYVAAHAIGGAGLKNEFAIADKGTFLGKYGQTNKPAAMSAGEDARPTGAKGFGRFGDAAAALGGEVTLKPGESVTLHYLIAIGTDQASCLSTIDKYLDPKAAHAVLAAAEKMWDGLLATKVSTEREDFNLLNNTWLPYQAIGGRLWGRTGYYQQSGAFGFRDQLQDTHVWLPIDPQRCLDHIHLAATRQFTDGSVNHWWHALADFGNHTKCSDDYLWLPLLVGNYIKETGQFGILTEKKIAFRDDANLKTDLLDHCLRSFRRGFARTSERGIPFIGSCDWNDGLSAMGVDERGESVWLGWFLCHLLREWAELMDRTGRPEVASEFRQRREKYVKDLNAAAWDGEWFRYGTKDDGEWIGSSKSAEGKIHLNAQTWAIMADATTDERATKAWASVKKQLLSPYGPLLLAPAYTVPDATIGYITRYSPGSRENGGVYMHAATWALLTACKLKDTAAVASIWSSIAPPVRGRDADKYWAEPYVLPGNVDGPLSEIPGKAGWTWYTGSAAWLNRVSLEWMLGIRPEWNGLKIDPCLPADFGSVRVSRKWRGRTIEVEFDAGGAGEGHAVVFVEGREVTNNLITPEFVSTIPSGGVVKVRVVWKSGVSVGGAAAAARK